jgi:Zn-dependent protease
MRASSLSIGRIFGIELRVHASWLLALLFMTWALATGYFRFVGPRQAGLGTPLLLGAISALLLFGCVLVHEFSHSLVARARGMRVRDITLFVFGGVSNIGGEARSARDDFFISAVGLLNIRSRRRPRQLHVKSIRSTSPTRRRRFDPSGC